MGKRFLQRLCRDRGRGKRLHWEKLSNVNIARTWAPNSTIEIWSFELFPTLHWMSVCHWEVSCKRSIKKQLQPSFSSVGTGQNDVFSVFYTKLVLVSNERLHAKNDAVGWLFPCGVTFCRTSVSTGKGWLYPAWGDLNPPLVLIMIVYNNNNDNNSNTHG